MSKVVHLYKHHKRTFTSAEAVLDAVREQIHKDGRTRQQLALATGVSHSTITHIATGTTRWPRHTTLFPLIDALGMRMILEMPS